MYVFYYEVGIGLHYTRITITERGLTQIIVKSTKSDSVLRLGVVCRYGER